MKEFLILKEALQFLGMSRASLYRLMDQGVINSYRIPRYNKIYFKREDLIGIFEPNENHQAQQAEGE